ncbi:hypothetical protein PAXRUDRAFT_826300 [Paxillus rubicundulus Ve08.2h10]|uniref:F-box domain-containing protein n=1 Tax=Paxillus rubicundulus Ve08.2h10 TaxID=930991 RepID=A0A0D0DZP4_9AGAM|nr:hypothetical protein PAXRUDRAFT_826300 [Paxillus rubicundulus Ve08.2h10]
MHRVLVVPEILLIIFDFITDDSDNPLRATLAAVARTCRSFQSPAEGILWSELRSIQPLYSILPAEVRKKETQTWSLVSVWSDKPKLEVTLGAQTRRTLSGSNWSRFMERASCVRVLTDHSFYRFVDHEGYLSVFCAMGLQRKPFLLTPNLRKLRWKTPCRDVFPAIHLFLGPSLLSLEIDVTVFIDHITPIPSFGDACPKLKHMKIVGNGRSIATEISSILRGLHLLETASCSTLDNEALIHLARLSTLSSLELDMRWSAVSLDHIRDRCDSGSFKNLKTLRWKDYNLATLVDIIRFPHVSPTNFHLEIESFCTTQSLRIFLESFTKRFPRTQFFSLVHDVHAGRRFGLQAAAARRDHLLDSTALESLFALRGLRGLNLTCLGRLQPDDILMNRMAPAWPALEALTLASADVDIASVTFGGLLSLLKHCPHLRHFGLRVNAEHMLSFDKTEVRQVELKHVRLQGDILASRRAEVDELLMRVLPGLASVEESLGINSTSRVRKLKKTTCATGEAERG